MATHRVTDSKGITANLVSVWDYLAYLLDQGHITPIELLMYLHQHVPEKRIKQAFRARIAQYFPDWEDG